MSKYKYLNTGEEIPLHKLIISGDLKEDSLLEVYGAEGSLLAKGAWYHVLEHMEDVGTAWNPDGGDVIHFKQRRG